MGPCSRPMSPGQLELWIIFFFPPEALSCPRHRGHRTSEAERTRWACLPSRCGPASWSFGSFFFSSRSLVCRCHRGRCTSEAERTRWARLPSRCGSASWSFGSFFFFLYNYFYLQSRFYSPPYLPSNCSTSHTSFTPHTLHKNVSTPHL